MFTIVCRVMSCKSRLLIPDMCRTMAPHMVYTLEDVNTQSFDYNLMIDQSCGCDLWCICFEVIPQMIFKCDELLVFRTVLLFVKNYNNFNSVAVHGNFWKHFYFLPP